MKTRIVCLIATSLALTAAVFAQDANTAPPAPQTPAQGLGPEGRQGLGWRGGGSGRMAETGMGGRGVAGTVIAMAPGYYTVKTDGGQIFKVQFSANTRFLKQAVQKQGEKSDAAPANGERGNRQQSPPEPIKPTDIKVGDEIAALGEVSQTANSVGATLILQVDPERAKQMREHQAEFGKTWLMGKVTAINETTVSLAGSLDNATHNFKADENTTFRKRRAPITLGDVQVGDTVRVEGAVKDGSFIAASVSVMGMPPGGMLAVPRDAAPAPQPR